MRIGLSYDLREGMPLQQNSPEDALEEYDSLETVEIIALALEAKGHSVIKLGGGMQFLDNVRQNKVDIVFNIAEGRGNCRSREAQVPSILEMLDIPYTGSDPLCLAVCLDKATTKKLVAADSIITPQWLVIASKEELERTSWDGFPFPAIIKPAYEGSSKGIRLSSLIYSVQQARQEAGKILGYYRQPVMIEKFIAGDEVTVGVIGNTPPKVVGMMRVVPKKKEECFIYSLEVKRDYLSLVDYRCPADLGQDVLDMLADASLRVYKVLGCRDFARLDFRVSPEGMPYFIEMNPLPGLGTYSDLVIMALKLGWTHTELIVAVLDAALERYPQCVSV